MFVDDVSYCLAKWDNSITYAWDENGTTPRPTLTMKTIE